jgi:Domain of unknown function (DUF6249)
VSNGVSGVIFLIPITVLVGIFTIAALGVVRSTRLREARLRERLAMIERGLTPPPELDPGEFERAAAASQAAARRRFMGAGIMLVTVGLGVGLLIGVAAEATRIAVGVGGAIALLGLGLITNALVNTAS